MKKENFLLVAFSLSIISYLYITLLVSYVQRFTNSLIMYFFICLTIVSWIYLTYLLCVSQVDTNCLWLIMRCHENRIWLCQKESTVEDIELIFSLFWIYKKTIQFRYPPWPTTFQLKDLARRFWKVPLLWPHLPSSRESMFSLYHH